MYQIEVKAALVEHCFHPGKGWSVTVDLDSMERAKGGQHPPDKKERAAKAELALRALGVTIGAHSRFGRADMVAIHPEYGTIVLEVEGDSSRQREQAMYSALGQAMLVMHSFDAGVVYGIAVPDRDDWLRQVSKIPAAVAERLCLQVFAVGVESVRSLGGGMIRDQIGG